MITFIGPRALHVPIPIYGDPVTDNDGIEYRPVTGYVPGYHVNIARAGLTEALEPFEVTPGPNTPVNTWAGDTMGEDGRWMQTAFLEFTNEAAAKSALAGLLFEEVS